MLIVEDERKLRELVRSCLERAGSTVVPAGSGAEVITMAAAARDLVVLDLGLPDLPGDTVARELRAAAPVPILMLTAKSAEEDRIRGLELGADDYVTKPFSPRELVLRVQAILRRGRPGYRPGGDRLRGGTLVIDEPQRRVTVLGETVSSRRPDGVSWWRWPRSRAGVELINRVRGMRLRVTSAPSTRT